MNCYTCSTNIDTTAAFTDLPAGKRLAFDPSNARLWIVCPKCGRWNIAPLDEPERRTAVARLEQFYTATPRAEMHGIGVAEPKGRASLIRVGDVTWSQFAAWRYGSRLKRRRREFIVAAVVGLPFVAFVMSPLGTAAMSSWLGGGIFGVWVFWFLWKYGWRTMFRVPDETGRHRAVRMDHALKARIAVDDTGWRLLLKRDKGVSELRGLDAIRALTRILPWQNRKGAKQSELNEAIAMIEEAGGPQQLLATYLAADWLGPGTHLIAELPRPLMLALEIAAHEEIERRALQGELAALELDWREAEETARVE